MKYITQNKNWRLTEDYNMDKLLYLLIDRPDETNKHNTFIWLNEKNQHCKNYVSGNILAHVVTPNDNKKQVHRDYDLLTYVWNNTEFLWIKNDIVHRENNKPADINADGHIAYFINGKKII